MSDNLSTIRGIYDAFAKGDVPAILAALSPKVSWTDAEGFEGRTRFERSVSS